MGRARQDCYARMMPRPQMPCRPLPKCTLLRPAHLPPALQAPARRLELGEPAAFLLHQIELDSSHRLGRVEDLLPRTDPLAEQDAKALLLRLRARCPVLEVKAPAAARMALDPRDRILAGFETRADIELEDELRRSVRGEDVHDPLAALELLPLVQVVVEAREQSVWLELLGRRRELAAGPLPVLQA